MNESQGQIFIIDDTPANLHLLVNLLKEKGYLTRAFPSGKLALAVIEKSSPSLILLDIQMPQMNGYEVCQHLKANESTADIPVIFISALDEMMDKVKAFSVGGVDYITKPFQAEEVLARISTHLELSRLQKLLKQENSLQAQQLAEQNRQLQSMNQALEQANQELKQQYDRLHSAQLQLVQSEKMSALGNLVAGVAHEINNPVGFISGNIQHALDYIKDLFGLLDLVKQESGSFSEAIQEEIAAIDLEYIREDLPKLIDSMREGAHRIKDISTSLRTFSRADSELPIPFNLPEGIDSTILILKHRLKASENRPEIAVVKKYGKIPMVECYAGQLNQVFMNILANAIEALDESNFGRSYADIQLAPNRIVITTSLEDKSVKITIADNGKGMSSEVKNRIFDHLFTTKGVGKGTGLGLAIARQIVVEKHGGTIEVNSTLGVGTEFAIVLPISEQK
ncbi:MAG: response regulator [Microcoleus sp. PH2017_10_PVI_O_A]|uniref:hybrid sensor histidine kinase/response regulator n=1 Tax=unclassified Microcoleus TaxID=2642155 RepID=UPI001DB25F5A|nr:MULTISPECIES: response regulator [unclassified Microcoleus]TAE79047.1 MAG: response regulator [Oscillatoriales cyanobacterium]MCC3407507.1 response regulator [Microcoleus sp. PH2017_10_PVI_O_A]MCC3461575.1 response regulator [Microcoleus sp. PH2017_11_PCY_U_A]MCC3480062.1 response regulator [Microcoleus sp. PH2017_12_PCY_D_A]MCC3529768.1 response regulator [Microcoleus sp. PH2017_21_RUC_O_A]